MPAYKYIILCMYIYCFCYHYVHCCNLYCSISESQHKVSSSEEEEEEGQEGAGGAGGGEEGRRRSRRRRRGNHPFLCPSLGNYKKKPSLSLSLSRDFEAF